MRNQDLAGLASACLCGLLMVLWAGEAPADETRWILAPPDIGDWFDYANWDNGVPGNRDDAYLTNGGTIRLSYGTAMADELWVGFYGMGAGTVEQRGGIANFDNLHLRFGGGTYVLDDGVLDVDAPTFIGYSGGTGHFVQNGGTYNQDFYIKLGRLGYGTYEMNGGTFCTGDIYVGEADGGSDQTFFKQTGGDVEGAVRVERGEYQLQGGQLETSDLEVTGRGRFQQSGGTAIVYDDLILRRKVVQDGGSMTVHDDLRITGNRTATSYTMSGGRLTVERLNIGGFNEDDGGLFCIKDPACEIEVRSVLGLRAVGALDAVPGAAIHMTGAAFENETTDPDAFPGLGNLELIFEGGPADTDPVEVAGEDRGPVWDGFVGNFAFGGLTVGGAAVGQIQLVDDSDNGNRDGPAGAAEAQYVKRLRVGPGSKLDLGGLNLYCLSSAIDPSATILTGGGSLTKVPAVKAVSATVLATTFSPTGGAHGLGILALDDVADIVLETDDGQQTTYAGGTVALETYLFSDDSSGGLASGLFCDGTILLADAGGNDLLAADLLELLLQELPDQHLLAGSGRFEITGGSLQGGFPYTVGEVVQITFQIDPSGIADFASAFTGLSDVTLTPEPATLALLAAGAAGVWMRKRRGTTHRGTEGQRDKGT